MALCLHLLQLYSKLFWCVRCFGLRVFFFQDTKDRCSFKDFV